MSDIECQTQILNAVFLIAEHKRAAVSDPVQVLLQQENSPAPAHSSRGKFLADSPLVPALVMFIETPLYDVLSSQKAVDDDQIRQNRMRLSMAVDGNYRINEV